MTSARRPKRAGLERRASEAGLRAHAEGGAEGEGGAGTGEAGPPCQSAWASSGLWPRICPGESGKEGHPERPLGQLCGP